MPKYDNSERLSTVSDTEWQKALDELTAYLKWRLKGRIKWGAHSERVLETPAFDFYQEEAVIKLLAGDWKWQERYTLGQQLTQIAGNLITKNAEKWAREHPAASQSGEITTRRKPEFIELRDPELLPDLIDDDGNEDLDETYEMVFRLVKDDEELTLYVRAIRACGHFNELPKYLGMPTKQVYRLQEKLVRRLRKLRVESGELRVQEEDSDEGKKRMRFIDKIYLFEAESRGAEENYRAFGTTRELHQTKMLEFIHKKLAMVKGECTK